MGVNTPYTASQHSFRQTHLPLPVRAPAHCLLLLGHPTTWCYAGEPVKAGLPGSKHPRSECMPPANHAVAGRQLLSGLLHAAPSVDRCVDRAPGVGGAHRRPARINDPLHTLRAAGTTGRQRFRS